MIDPSVCKRDNIKIGMIGIIKEHEEQSEKDFVEGKIVGILTQDNFDPKGIRVSLDNGAIGNLVMISGSENSLEIIKKRISSRENNQVERKATFAYDINFSKRNDDLQKLVAIAVSSLINTDGGFVYIGVTDDGKPIGLENDYSVMQNRANNDGFEDKLKQYFNKILSDPILQQQCLTFSFPIIDEKEICEIFVKPSPKPIFFNPKRYEVLVGDKKQQRWFDDFYIRRGNSHYLIEKNSEFFDYLINRFVNN